MLRRTLLSLVNLAVLAAVTTVWLTLPAYSTYAVYGCLGWIVAALALMYSAWGNRPVGATAAPAPLATGTSGGGPGALDFCIYCGTTFGPGATRCAACGRAARPA